MKTNRYALLMLLASIFFLSTCHSTHNLNVSLSQCQYIGYSHPHDVHPYFFHYFSVSDIILVRANIGVQISELQNATKQPFIEKFTVLDIIKGSNYKINDSLSINHHSNYHINFNSLRDISTQKDSMYYVYINNIHKEDSLKYKLERHFTYGIPVGGGQILEHLYTIYLCKIIRDAPDGIVKINYPPTHNQDLFLKGYVKNGKLRSKFYIYADKNDEKCIGLKTKSIPFLEGYIAKNGNGYLKKYDIQRDKKGNSILKETYSIPFLYE